MTKTIVDESPDELLIRARRIANFSGSWPAEFSPDQIAALMAKGWKNENKQAYFDNRRLISHAITEGWLSVRTEKHHKPKTVVPKYDYGEFARRRLTLLEQPETTTTLQLIGAPDCATWLKSRRIKANEYITEWLRACGIDFSRWKTQQERDAQQTENSNPPNRYQEIQELCKKAIRKVWERDESVNINAKSNSMADQPELKPFLNADPENKIPKRSRSWIEELARKVAQEMGRSTKGGAPPRGKSTRSR